MMKVIYLTFFFFFIGNVSGQITAVSSFTNPYAFPKPPHLDKFHISGYKYVSVNLSNLTINVFNTNLTLFKTINIPATVGGVNTSSLNAKIEHLSEKLFDLDSLMEYGMTLYLTSGNNSQARTYVFKENGTQVFFCDSAILEELAPGDPTIFNNVSNIYFDGTNTMMRLTRTPYYSGIIPVFRYFILPGSIPCSQCGGGGIITGKQTIKNPDAANPVFYPNPVTDQLKLKYELPKDYKTADIKIYDLQGKLIETFKVTDTFDFIYLPSDYNNGLYLYSLNVDGKTIKTEKIILNK
jgi:hypothetical protein